MDLWVGNVSLPGFKVRLQGPPGMRFAYNANGVADQLLRNFELWSPPELPPESPGVVHWRLDPASLDLCSNAYLGGRLCSGSVEDMLLLPWGVMLVPDYDPGRATSPSRSWNFVHDDVPERLGFRLNQITLSTGPDHDLVDESLQRIAPAVAVGCGVVQVRRGTGTDRDWDR